MLPLSSSDGLFPTGDDACHTYSAAHHMTLE